MYLNIFKMKHNFNKNLILLTFVNSNFVNFGDVPDPISYIFGCNFTFALSVMVTFFKIGALLNVLAKISTWWQLSSWSEADFSGRDKALCEFDLPAIRIGSYKINYIQEKELLYTLFY